MKNPIVKYGLIAGLIMIGMMLISWFLFMPYLDYRSTERLGYVSMLLALSMIFFGLRAYRAEQGGLLSFGKGMQVGTLINLIPAGFMFVYTFFLFLFKGDEFMEWSMSAMSPEEAAYMETQMAQMPDWVQSPFFQGFVMFMTVFILGLVVTLISAAILRKTA